MNMINFWRGSAASYKALATKNENYLYFITSVTADDDIKVNSLYMGETLIAQVNDTDSSAVTNLINTAIANLDGSATATGEFISFVVNETDGILTTATIDETKLKEALATFKTKQTAVDNKITASAHVLSSLTQDQNGNISYEVKTLTPADIGAQVAGDYKTKQTAVADPSTTDATTTEFIASISQDENGVITPIKKKITAAELGLASAMHFVGALEEAPSSPTAGDVYLNIDTKKEYVYDETNGWVELGDEGSYALKTVTITGTGYLTGGGSLEENREIDIESTVKTKIDHGEAAYNWGNHANAGYITDISGKADKVTEATANNFAGLDANGNLIDSGKKAEDFVSAEGYVAYSQAEKTKLEGIEAGAEVNQIIATGSTNGTIAVDGTDVAVFGLGSAAYTNSDAYDAKDTAKTLIGAQQTSQSAATGVYAAIQGETTNTVKDCVDAINTMNSQVGSTIGTVQDIVAMLTWIEG